MQKTFRFWRVLEALTPNEAARVDRSGTLPVYGVDVSAAGAALPWNDPEHLARHVDAGTVWSYNMQGGVHDAASVFALAVRNLQQAGHYAADQRSRKARLFDLDFDAQGYPVATSFRLSLAAWAAGYLAQPGNSVQSLIAVGASRQQAPADETGRPTTGFSEFDAAEASLLAWVRDEARALRAQSTPAKPAWVRSVVQRVLDATGLPNSIFDGALPCHIKAAQVRETADMDTSESSALLGSFFVEDLAKLEHSVEQRRIGQALATFLRGSHGIKRLDVRSPDAESVLLERLHPRNMPQGRWPSDHALVFSQQLAVNSAWQELRDGAGLFAVNGPPGTGKTTMLRDVVAAVVTERAAVLARLGASVFSAKRACRVGDTWVPYYELGPELSGYSIVVASSNNGAVENVTRELPGIESVPTRVGTRGEGYFREIASQVAMKDAWGLLAAPLGKSGNRNAFLRAFWWGGGPSSEIAPSVEPRGMRAHLKNLQSIPQLADLRWENARIQFAAAQQREREARLAMEAVAGRADVLAKLVTDHASAKSRILTLIEAAVQQRADAQAAGDVLRDHTEQLASLVKSLSDLAQAKLATLRQKPGAVNWVLTLGGAHRQWRKRYGQQLSQYEAMRAQAQLGKERLEAAEAEAIALTDTYIATVHAAKQLRKQLTRISKKIEDEERQMHADQQALGSAWPRTDVLGTERETGKPWASAQWLQARQDVFLSALDLHRAFIEKNATQIVANIGLASDWLNGKRMPTELAQLALDSLCLVVPVISTTFASMSRMGRDLGPESIGWLLIDEAGQALPQHAAGSLWRARRAIVVGDPLQLEPVQALPASVESAVAAACGAPVRLWPSVGSVQGLADQASQIGTMVGEDSSGAVWVGCPLRLHCRCDEPMFSISNEVAYDGQMVLGKRAQTSTLPPSAWLHVSSRAADGHWVEDEGESLQDLLEVLRGAHGVDPQQIALISPFREVARQLRAIGRRHGIEPGKMGTVHTAQGKEAEVVVLVLGGDPQAPGAKAWAASKPNLVNVAVSRARQRLYVVGDRKAWKGHRYFEVLAKHLPVKSKSEKL